MVRDDNKIKISDEKPMKNTSDRIKQDDTDIKDLDYDIRVNEILKDVKKRPWLNLTLRYILAVIIVLIAFWLYFVMTDLFGPGLPTYILFYPAIIIVALLGGFGPGVLATSISVLLAVIWIIPPSGQLEITSAIEGVGAVIFTTFGVIISAVSELYRRNKVKAAAYDKEMALRETLKEKEFLANILERASQPFAIGFPDGGLGLFNPAFEQLTGYTKNELHSIDWSTKLTPVKWRQMEQQKLDELNKSGEPVRYEKEYIRKDGSLVPIELLVSITLDKDGEPEYYYSFITDITERKNAEEDLQRQAALLDVSYEAIFSWDYDGGILSWNRGAERLYGFNKEEAIGFISHELLKTKFPIEFRDFEDILASDKMWTGELTHTTKNGKKIIVESRQQLIRDTSNRNIVIETNRDITERKKAENYKQKLLETEQQLTEELSATNEELQATSEELQTSNEELIIAKNNLTELVGKLKTSNKELEQFAHVASHDLQEPLRMVASFTQLLERRYKGRLDEDADDYIGFIVEGAQRMKSLIDDLLTFSRLNTEPSNYEPILIEVALDDVLFNLKSSIEENKAIITYDPLPTVMGDLPQIRQLFQNLISNAIKFHGDEPPKIHISVKELEKEWLFGVSDNGIGINHNHQEQIFNIFKRLHTRKDYEGTGIGLAICKSIIERHGGKIWVVSEENKGSTFYFTLSKLDMIS